MPLKFIKCLPIEILNIFKEELLKAKRSADLDDGEIQDYLEIANQAHPLETETGAQPEFYKKFVRGRIGSQAQQTSSESDLDCNNSSSRRGSLANTHDVIGKHLSAFYRKNQS